jgi:Putative peptidoglycan binding domain
MNHQTFTLSRTATAVMLFTGSLVSMGASAASYTDVHGNVGYDTAAECDAAVLAGTAKFYQPYTSHEPLKRAGEVSVKQGTIKDLAQAQASAKALGYDSASYAKGACDIGVGRSNGRDGVTAKLIGKYIPFSNSFPVNLYMDASGTVVRAMMQQCDNNFSKNLPRPVAGATVLSGDTSDCYATVVTPAKFETKTEEVIKVPVTSRTEIIPATYKTVTEEVVARPETKRQIPVAATYKTISEEVVVRAAEKRFEPIPATYKMVAETVEVKPAGKRLEVIPATFKTVTEQVLVSPESKKLTVVPATYKTVEETVADRPATTSVVTVPPTYKTITETVVVRPESVRYEPIAIPLRKVTEQVALTDASKRLETTPATFKTVTERIVVREASKRLTTVPAVYETVTERIKVAEAYKEWKRGRAYIGQALDVRPVQGFIVGKDGLVAGARVSTETTSSAAVVAAPNTGSVETLGFPGAKGNDEVMCLVLVPEQYQTISRQVLKTPATTTEVEVPAEYSTVTRQVLDKPASTKEVDIPGTSQTVTRFEIDAAAMKAQGYRFDDKGDIVAAPNGDRILRAGSIAGMNASRLAAGAIGAGKAGANGGLNAGGANANTAGAQSGQEGYVREIKIAGETRAVSRQVVDQPATVRTVEVPGTTKVIKRTVVDVPASTTEQVIPAVYKTVTKSVVDQAASTREIAIPAVFQTVQKRVVDVPATTREFTIPAVTQTVKRQVIDVPASVREEVIPAVYRTISKQVIDKEASTREIEIPAKYETLNYQVKVSDSVTVRRAILCETNATPKKIREIQLALKKAGYNPGEINGVLKAQTMSAVNKYQKAQNLPIDGFLNLETVKSLGVSAN